MTSKFKIWKYIRLGLSSLVCRPFLPSKLTGEQRTLLLLVSILFIFAEYCVCVCVWALDLAQDRIVAVNLYYIILYSAARAHCMGIEFHSCWYWTWLCAICCVACWCWCWCVLHKNHWPLLRGLFLLTAHSSAAFLVWLCGCGSLFFSMFILYLMCAKLIAKQKLFSYTV